MKLDKIKTTATINFLEDFENKQEIILTYNEEKVIIGISGRNGVGYKKGENMITNTDEKILILLHCLDFVDVLREKVRGEYDRQWMIRAKKTK